MHGRWQINRRGRRILALAAIVTSCFSIYSAWMQFDPKTVHARGADNDYADPATCLRCHAGIAATYLKSGMGQSFHRAATASQIEDFQNHNEIYNQASDRRYKMV